jgi:hypothetical protein
MPIIDYVPRVVTPIDNRRKDGGFYKAECEVCSQIFYPLRSNARFCSRYCSSRHHHARYKQEGRYRYAKGGKAAKTATKAIYEDNRIVTGAVNVWELLTHDRAMKREFSRQKLGFIAWLKLLSIGDDIYTYDNGTRDIKIARISDRKWYIFSDI